MATGLFTTRNPDMLRGPQRRRALSKVRGVSAADARRVRERTAKVGELRNQLADHLAEGRTIKDAAAEMGVSKSSGIKLFAQIRDGLGLPVKD